MYWWQNVDIPNWQYSIFKESNNIDNVNEIKGLQCIEYRIK